MTTAEKKADKKAAKKAAKKADKAITGAAELEAALNEAEMN